MQIPWFETTATGSQTIFVGPGSEANSTVTLTYDDTTVWVDDADPDESDRSELEMGQLGRGPAKQAYTGRPYNAYVPIRQARQRERGIGHRNFRSRAEKGRQRWGRKRPR